MSVEAPRNVLIVGSGAREHAIGWKIHQDAQKSGQSVKQHFAPGNAGTSELGTNHDIGAEDIDKITDFAVDQGINLVIFGSEAPLFAGGVNAIEEAARKKGVDGVDLEAFGPSRSIRIRSVYVDSRPPTPTPAPSPRAAAGTPHPPALYAGAEKKLQRR